MIFSAQALLFDMDGVLIDSAPAVERVWRAWALAHGLDPAAVVDCAHGRRSIETIRAVAPELDAVRENDVVENMEILDREGVTALPGAAEMLRSLPVDRFAIVTSATRPLAIARMGYAELRVPSNFVTADDVVHGKPSPEPYLKGAALLDFPPEACIVFEDTPAGISAARAAGMQVIALQTTYPPRELRAAAAIVVSLAAVQTEVRATGLTLRLVSTPAGLPDGLGR